MSTITTALSSQAMQLECDAGAEALHDLIRLNLRSARHLNAIASMIDDAVLRHRALGIAAQRLDNAAELEDALAQHGGSGALRVLSSFIAAARRWWSAFRTPDDHADVAAITSKTATDAWMIDRAYTRAMRDLAATSATWAVQRQYAHLLPNQSIIARLCDMPG